MILSRLIRTTRLTLGMTATELAARLGYDPSYISLVERGLRRLDEEAIVQVALALNIDPTEALLASLRERLPEALRQYAPTRNQVQAAEGGYSNVRDFQARDFEFEIGRSLIDVTADWDGNVHVLHTLEDCRPNPDGRPLYQVAFRRQVPGIEANQQAVGRFELIKAPPQLEYEHEALPADDTIIHRIVFPRGWRRTSRQIDDSFTFVIETYQPEALVLDAERFLKRAQRKGIVMPFRGSLNTYLRYFIRKLEVVLTFPQGYEPDSLKPWVWWGHGSLEQTTRDLGARPCSSLEFRSNNNKAHLTVDEPLAGYTFSITWAPLDPQRYIEARYGGSHG